MKKTSLFFAPIVTRLLNIPVLAAICPPGVSVDNTACRPADGGLSLKKPAGNNRNAASPRRGSWQGDRPRPPGGRAAAGVKSVFLMPLYYLVAGLMLLVLSAGHATAVEDFNLPGIDGKTYRLSDYRGKWVVVNYWATWCPPCRVEIPDLVEFHERNKGKAVVLGIAYEQISTEQLKKFATRFAINYPVLKLEPGSPDVLGPIPGLPTTYLVSPEGKIVGHQAGIITGEAIEKFIRKHEK